MAKKTVKVFRKIPLPEVVLWLIGLGCLVPSVVVGWDAMLIAMGSGHASGWHVTSRVKSGTVESGYFGRDPQTVTVRTDVVAFRTSEGKRVTFETHVPDEHGRDEIPIVYALNSPQTACIEPCSYSETAGICFAAGVVMCAAAFGSRLYRKSGDN